MSKQYNINWKHGDYIKLGKAVSNFNKIRNKLYDNEKSLYLPDVIDYNNLKNNIKTRNELNRQINSLKRFSNLKEQEPIELKGGEIITKWEYKELNKKAKKILKELKEEEQQINKKEHPLPTQRELEIKVQKQGIKNFSSK